MKKLLNTLYLTQDNFYLTRERDNIVIKQEGALFIVSPIGSFMASFVFHT